MSPLQAQYLDLEHQVGNHEHLVCPACLAIDVQAARHGERETVARKLEERAQRTDSDSARSILFAVAAEIRRGT